MSHVRADGLPRNRIYRCYTYAPLDRVPDVEFGCWPQTIRRWVAEGFPRDWAQEIGESMFHKRFECFIGTDAGQDLEQAGSLWLRLGINPPFPRVVLEEDEKTQVIRDEGGVVARWYKSGSEDASIPEYLDFPVRDWDTWRRVKDRYRIDDPDRRIDDQTIQSAQNAAAQGWMVSSFMCGFYGALRGWVGVENLSYLFYDEPALVHDMAEHWAKLALAQVRALPDELPVHQFNWWEDMCYNGGPLCSVEHFHTFFVPRYKMVMAEVARRGCRISSVDSDGNIHALVPGWLEAGVNVMFPNEVAAGTDMFAMRARFGREVRLQGGIAKKALVEGRDAIDRELDRIAPLLEQGGFVPHLDHLVPPDVSLENYMYYRQQKRKLIGKN